MAVFGKPISQLVSDDLQELLSDSAVENNRLEFKSEAPEKDEMLKKLSSFANSFGGYLIVGAKASSADGRLIALPGVELQNSYKQKIVAWCFDSVSPPLMVEISDPLPVPIVGDGNESVPPRFCYAIYSPESDLAPHFLNGRKGVWVRADEFSHRYPPRLAEENELRHLLNRREIVQRRRDDVVKRSRERFRKFLSRYQETSPKACLEMSLGPRFPVSPLTDHSQLAEVFRDCRFTWRTDRFPYDSSNFVSQHESAIYLSQRDSRNKAGLVESTVWGMLFYGMELEVEITPRLTGGIHTSISKGIHIHRLIGYLLLFTEHAKRMLLALGYAGSITLDVALTGILGIPWLYSESNLLFQGPLSELDDSFTISLNTTTDVLITSSASIVTKLLQYILFGMNWADHGSDPARLTALLLTGYGYNMWQPPPSQY